MNHLRTIFIAALFISASVTSNAQQWLAGVELNVGLPTGDLGKIANPGLGYAVEGAYGISPSLFIGASIGVHNFGVDGVRSGESGNIRAIHLGITGRYLLQPAPQRVTSGIIPYVALGLERSSLTAQAENANGDTRSKFLEAAWGISPQAGVMIPLGESPSKAGYIDPSLKFHTIFTEGSSVTMFSINIGYRGFF